MKDKIQKERIETIGGFSAHAVFSQVAGAITLTSTNFLEVAKIRLISDVRKCSPKHYSNKMLYLSIKNYFQKNKVNFLISNFGKKCKSCLPSRNTFSTFYYILKTEGFRYTFFSGIGNTVYSNVIRIGCFFPIFEFFKIKAKRNLPDHSQIEMSSTLIGSSFARFITTVTSFPFEVSKIRAQTGQFKGNNSFFRNSINIIKERKKYVSIFSAFFQRELIFTLIFWSIFEKLREKRKIYYNNNINDIRLKVHSAFISGAVASFITFPFDIIQTNLIVDKNPIGFFQILILMRQKYGISFLFNGLFIRMLKGSITTGVFFTIYELLKINEKEFSFKK